MTNISQIRLKSLLTQRTPWNHLSKSIPQDDALWKNEAFRLLLKDKEVVVVPLGGESESASAQSLSVETLQLLIARVNNDICEIIDNYGASDLACVKEYVKNLYDTEMGREVENCVMKAIDAVKLLCLKMIELNKNLETFDAKCITQKELQSLKRIFVNVFDKLLSVRWVNTPILYALNIFERLYNLSAEKDASMMNDAGTSNKVPLMADVYPIRSLVVGSLLDRVLQIVHLENFKIYLPKVYAVAAIAYPAATHLAGVLPLAVITVLDDIETNKEIIEPMLKYLMINVTLEFMSRSNYFESSFTLPNMLTCVHKLSKFPTEFEYHAFKCFALLGSLNTTETTDIVRFYPLLLDNKYSQYHSGLLKWLERVFNNNTSSLWVHKKTCRSFINSRSFRNFKPFITRYIQQSSRSIDISDEAKNAISLLSSLTISFDIKNDLKETLMLISFYKNDDFAVLNFIVGYYLRLQSQIQEEREKYILANPELSQASLEKQILAAVLQNNELKYDKPNLKQIESLEHYYASEFDAFDQASCLEPQVHLFPKLALYAKIGAILYWLASEDLECNDVIKDDIDDLTTPILTFAKFMIFKKSKLATKNGVVVPDYDTWSGFTSQASNDKSDDEESDGHNMSSFNNDNIFRSQADSCPSTALRMLKLIGKLNVVTKNARAL